jgi:hypothetical protein
MQATVMDGAGDVRVETVADARRIESTDSVVGDRYPEWLEHLSGR